MADVAVEDIHKAAHYQVYHFERLLVGGVWDVQVLHLQKVNQLVLSVALCAQLLLFLLLLAKSK